MPRLSTTVASTATRGQTQMSAPSVRRVLEPAGVAIQKADRYAKVQATLSARARREASAATRLSEESDSARLDRLERGLRDALAQIAEIRARGTASAE